MLAVRGTYSRCKQAPSHKTPAVKGLSLSP